MTKFLLLIMAAFSQIVCSNLIRCIQANSRDRYTSIASNYVIAFLLALVYCFFSWHPSALAKVVSVGIFTGFFYTTALLMTIRNMGQRGLALTVAIVNLSMLVPAVIAIVFGERPVGLQIMGMFLAAAAIPLLSLSNVSGKAIRERPSGRSVLSLFLLQSGAMSGNLFAFKLLPSATIPIYLVALFGSGLIFSLLARSFFGQRSTSNDITRGLILGFFNIVSAFIILNALIYLSGYIFFAVVGALGLVINMVLGVWLWRERIHFLGWCGFILAVAAILMLNIGHP